MVSAFLGLGSNYGNKVDNINMAIKLLRESEQMNIKRVSSLYETEPVGVNNQDDFLNCAVRIDTALDPHALLKLVKSIEREIGRTPNSHMEPRIIDIDILLYEDTDLESLDLKIPHPRLRTRRFVLEPLLEIDPDLTDPVSKRPLKDLLVAVREQRVKKCE
jgi:2-amino-4-hydroxy-6-hydroxymethyldihydropteridine diphosphokinase